MERVNKTFTAVLFSSRLFSCWPTQHHRSCLASVFCRHERQLENNRMARFGLDTFFRPGHRLYAFTRFFSRTPLFRTLFPALHSCVHGPFLYQCLCTDAEVLLQATAAALCVGTLSPVCCGLLAEALRPAVNHPQTFATGSTPATFAANAAGGRTSFSATNAVGRPAAAVRYCFGRSFPGGVVFKHRLAGEPAVASYRAKSVAGGKR
jgi:hypothetical protein